MSELRKMLIKKGDGMDAAVLYRVHRMSGALTKLMKQEGLYGYPGIRLMTFHGAKGLEFDAIIVWNANDQQYHGDDERQLLYTICSRAMHALTLTVTGTPSALLDGVPEDEYQLIKH